MPLVAAHRLEQPPSSRLIHVIIARFTNLSDADTVLSKISKLKETHYFLNQQLPPGKRGCKQFAYEHTDTDTRFYLASRMIVQGFSFKFCVSMWCFSTILRLLNVVCH